MAINALSGLPTQYDLVGPTVDDDVRRIIARWGAEAVKEAVRAQTKPKRGRKPEKDLPLLWPYIQRDAAEWLSGSDPVETWSDYAIAKAYADEHPGHSHPATMKRVIGRLKKNRRFFMLYEAERRSRDGYPYSLHLKALEELAETSGEVWVSILERAQRNIADFAAKHGMAPPDDWSMQEIEMAAMMPARGTDKKKQLGLLGRHLEPDEGAN